MSKPLIFAMKRLNLRKRCSQEKEEEKMAENDS